MMVLLYIFVLASIVNASNWFSAEPDYAKWTHAELRTWLEDHNIKVPTFFDTPHLYGLVDANWRSTVTSYAEAGRQWSFDQYIRAQRAFEHIKADSFDTWDESRLRTFLLEQGVVAPSGPREQLVVLAQSKYRAYSDAAALYSSLASASASSAYSSATDVAQSASQSIGSAVAHATHEVVRELDDARDYVYSTWDDGHLRSWLEEHGVVEAKTANTRDELVKLAKNYYRSTSSAVWESWSDSYIREWLIAHNLLKSTETDARPNLVEKMKMYYYNCSDNVWNTWSNSELKAWLVEHGGLKSDARRNHDELVKMLEEQYLSASDSVWGAWSDSDMRTWLSEHGYLGEKDEGKNRKYLVELINDKYSDGPKEVASYLVWPDARLRAYLRERGMNENALPTGRPGLLQETRIRWVQVSTRAETMFARLKDVLNSSVEAAEEKVAQILEVLSGHARHVSEKVDDARGHEDATKSHAWSWGSHKADQARGRGDEL